MNKFALRFYTLLLIGGAGFYYVRYLSSNESTVQEPAQIIVDKEPEDNTDKKSSKKEKDYHIGDQEFWDKALKAACMGSYDSDLKYLCKHEIEKIEVIAHWVEDGSEIKYNIVYKAPDGNSVRYYHSSLDEDLNETGGSSGGKDISQEAVAIKDCGEDKIYKSVYSWMTGYKYELEEIDAESVTLKYEENGKLIEQIYIFDRRGNEILEKISNSFVDENEAIKIISKDSGVDEDIIRNADEDTWMYLMMFNGLDTKNQIYHYQFTNKGYTYKYELDAISGKIITKDVQKDIGEKGALDIAMKKAGLTEDSFWQPSDGYMKFLVMPNVEKEVLSGEIIYKISIDANDNKVYYYEISGSEGKITRSTITEDFTIDKKSGTNNNLTYTISPEDKKSSKRTINLNELGIDDIYEYKDKVYLKIKYEGDKVLEWSIIDKDSKRNLGKLTNDDLNELYYFESNHKIINAGNITGGDILLSTLKENIIYEYTIPEGSYCEAHIINDLGTDCIIYEKDGKYSEDNDSAISYSITPMLKLLYPRGYPGQWGGCSWTDGHKYYLLYKKASIEDLFKVIPSYKILNLDKYKIGDKLTRNADRDYDKEYLYNNTDEDLTFFISSSVPKDRGVEDMVIKVPPKHLLFVSDSVDTVILTKKGTESKKMTKDDIIDLVISDRELDLDSIDKDFTKIKIFKDSSNNKRIYEVSMRDTKENQLYITYVDIENLYIMLEEKTMFSVLAEEPGLSFKKINDGIISYGLDNSNTKNFVCSIESDGIYYEYTIDTNSLEIISRKTTNSEGKLITYGPDNVIYPLEELDPHGSVYLSNLKENTLYKIKMSAEDVGNLYNKLGYTVLLTEKTVRIGDSNHNNRTDYETRVLEDGVGLGIGGSPTYDEEIYVIYRKPTTEELLEFIGEEKIIHLSNHNIGEKFNTKSYSDYLFNDTSSTKKITITQKVYYMSDGKEHLDDINIFLKPGDLRYVSAGISAVINEDFPQDQELESKIIHLSEYKKGQKFDVNPESDILLNDTPDAMNVVIVHEQKDGNDTKREIIYVGPGEEYDVDDLISFRIINL